MYKAFNIKLNDLVISNTPIQEYEAERKEYRDKLAKLVNSYDVIEADEIKKTLMPKGKYDVFISHSHKDLILAKKLASYLKTNLGLKCFIDSLYWGNIDDLLKELNKSHYDIVKQTYNHLKTEAACHHADIILASALTEMINACECVFFLNTDNSLPMRDDVLNEVETYSPWIFHEIYIASIIEKKRPIRGQMKFNESFRDTVPSEKQIAYKLDLSGMDILDFNNLELWSNTKKYYDSHGTIKHSLDVLYEILPIIKGMNNRY